MSFATANFIQRRQILEEALADVLRRLGDIDNDHELGLCLVIKVSIGRDRIEFDRYSLWDLATALEAKLE